jgi:hypothetical protein
MPSGRSLSAELTIGFSPQQRPQTAPTASTDDHVGLSPEAKKPYKPGLPLITDEAGASLRSESATMSRTDTLANSLAN